MSIQDKIKALQKEKRRKAYERKKYLESLLTVEELQRKKEDTETRRFFRSETSCFNI